MTSCVSHTELLAYITPAVVRIHNLDGSSTSNGSCGSADVRCCHWADHALSRQEHGGKAPIEVSRSKWTFYDTASHASVYI